jgi:hypothetical protein
LKLSFPSPQLTPMPAAIEVLTRDTFPEGVAFSAATAVDATAIAIKNTAILETVRTLNI